MNRFRDQCGQTTIILALSIFCLCGMAGFAVDVGTLFRAKRILQTAADAGAIAAAQEANYGDSNAAALAIAAQNGVTNGASGYTVTESIVSGGYRVLATQSAPTYFMRLFRLNSMTVSAVAVAANGPASGCIYTLDTSGTDIGLVGSGDLSMPDCGIVINSGSANALSLTGSSSIQALSIGIVGGYSVVGSGTLNPTPVTGVAPAPNPLAYITAPVYTASACLADPHYTGSTSYTIGPSTSGGTVCYNGLSIVGSGSLTLNPGVYVINGAFSSTGSGSISGSAITIYLAPPSGSLSMTGSGALNLSAPTSGTWDGILFYEDAADTNTMKLTGSGAMNIQGIFYAPNALLNLTGSGSGQFYADLVVHALSMTGSGGLQNYSNVNLSEPLTSARLVQ